MVNTFKKTRSPGWVLVEEEAQWSVTSSTGTYKSTWRAQKNDSDAIMLRRSAQGIAKLVNGYYLNSLLKSHSPVSLPCCVSHYSLSVPSRHYAPCKVLALSAPVWPGLWVLVCRVWVILKSKSMFCLFYAFVLNNERCCSFKLVQPS